MIVSNDKTQRFTAEVEQVLRQAGWFPGREVPVRRMEEWSLLNFPANEGVFQIRVFRAAWYILREFGDLHIEQEGQGLTGYGRSIVFNPLLVQGWGMWNQTGWDIAEAEWEANSILYPLGYYADPDTPFCVDMQGRVLFGDEYSQICGNSTDEALNNLILGIMPKKLPYVFERGTDCGYANLIRNRLGEFKGGEFFYAE